MFQEHLGEMGELLVCSLKARLASIVRIIDNLRKRLIRSMASNQSNHRLGVLGFDSVDVGQIRVVHGENVVKGVKVVLAQTPSLVLDRHIVSVADLESSRIRMVSNVKPRGSTRVNDVELVGFSVSLGGFSEHGLGHWRSADVSQADEEHVGHCVCVVEVCEVIRSHASQIAFWVCLKRTLS